MGRQRTWVDDSGAHKKPKAEANPFSNPDCLSEDDDLLRGPMIERERRAEQNEKDSKRIELYVRALTDGTIDRVCTAKQAQAFKLYVIQQMSLEAVAAFMNCRRQVVSQHVQAAAVKLKEEIGDVEDTDA